MIDRGDIRQAIGVAKNTGHYLGLHCQALVMGQFEQADGLIAKFKEVGGTVREIDV